MLKSTSNIKDTFVREALRIMANTEGRVYVILQTDIEHLTFYRRDSIQEPILEYLVNINMPNDKLGYFIQNHKCIYNYADLV